MRKLLVISICLLIALPWSGALMEAPGEAAEELRGKALELLAHIQAGEEDEAAGMMDEAMAGAMRGKLGALWAQLALAGGKFKAAGAWRLSEAEGYQILEMTLAFERLSLIQRTVFDAAGRVSGLFFTPGEVPEKEAVPEEGLPQGLSEEEEAVDAGGGFPLGGTLTLPEGEPDAGLVLVQGSGPSDRDERIGANSPFRDLAWGLAQRGLAVLRYDKRSYAYGKKIMESPDFAVFTVDEETALDAAAAVRMMKSRPELAGKKVFLLGHSLGGMLTAYINTLGAGADGYINLAGSPRKLWEISAGQNEMLALEADEKSAADIRQQAAEEAEKAKTLLTMSDEEAKAPGNLVMGLPAWYQRHLERIDAAALHLKDGLPVLILQGGRDRQTTLVDYELWQERLQGHPDASFILYPELNHLFGDFKGEAPPFSRMLEQEYGQRTPVPGRVMEDIAAWIRQRAK